MKLLPNLFRFRSKDGITADDRVHLRESPIACQLADVYSEPWDAPGRAVRLNALMDAVVRATEGSSLRKR